MKTAALSGTEPWHLEPLRAAPLHDDEGQTVTEYAAVLAILLIALTGVVFALQNEIASFIDKVAAALAEILP
jgi:Flp pilus assembly pilin Flp